MNNMTNTQKVRHELGQAMTEFVVCVGFIFLGLFVVVPTFGKLFDIKHQTLQASRYVAWERTVWLEEVDLGDDNQDDFVISNAEFESVAVRSTDDLYNSMRNRFFYGSGWGGIKPISSTDTGAAAGSLSPVWDYVQSKETMLAEVALLDDVEGDTDSIAYDVLDFISDGVEFIQEPIAWMMGVLGNDNEDLFAIDFNLKGYYAPTIITSLNTSNAKGGGAGEWELNNGGSGIEDMIFQSWDGKFTMHSAILADGWNAQSVGYYEDRVDNFVPSTVFDFDLMDALITIASLLEGGPTNSAIGKLDFGYVGVEPMPGEEGQPMDVSCDGGFCNYDE